jgi:hypothetical protein
VKTLIDDVEGRGRPLLDADLTITLGAGDVDHQAALQAVNLSSTQQLLNKTFACGNQHDCLAQFAQTEKDLSLQCLSVRFSTVRSKFRSQTSDLWADAATDR